MKLNIYSKRIIITLTLSLMTSMAISAVPNQFKKGDTTSADLINTNFDEIGNRLDASLQRAKEGNLPPHTVQGIPPYTYTRQAISSPVGKVEEIEGIKFIIVSYPIVDTETGNKYIVTYPITNCIDIFDRPVSTCNRGISEHDMSFEHANSDFESEFLLDGFPASFKVIDVRRFAYSYNPNEIKELNSLSTPELMIKVGGTLVRINMALHTYRRSGDGSSVTEWEASLPAGTTDFSKVIPWSFLEKYTPKPELIYGIIDRVAITKVQ